MNKREGIDTSKYKEIKFNELKNKDFYKDWKPTRTDKSLNTKYLEKLVDEHTDKLHFSDYEGFDDNMDKIFE